MSYYIIVGLVCVLAGLAAGYLVAKKMKEEENKKLNNTAEDIISKAKKEGEEIIKEAKLESKEIIFKGRQDLEKEIKEKKKDISHIERKLEAREETLEKKMESALRKEEQLVKRDQEYDRRMKDIDVIKAKNEEIKQSLIKEVERVACMTGEEAKKMLIEQMVDEAKKDSARTIRELEEEAKNESEKRARSIISTAIQRCASEFTNDITVTLVNLPNDEMKGRIIGREGRNIRTFETITGVDIIVDDFAEKLLN